MLGENKQCINEMREVIVAMKYLYNVSHSNSERQ